MIQEAYVSFEVAKLLKEKGFNVPCCRRYKGDSTITQSALYSTPFYQEEKSSEYVLCPTHQMAMAWLREKYNIHIKVERHNLYYEGREVFPLTKEDKERGHTPYYYGAILDKKSNLRITEHFDTYEEAVEAAIKYCLKNLI